MPQRARTRSFCPAPQCEPAPLGFRPHANNDRSHGVGNPRDWGAGQVAARMAARARSNSCHPPKVMVHAMQIVPRDLALIRWINGWGAVTTEQISSWMNVDASTCRRRLRKLIDANLLRRLAIRFLTSSPIAATEFGCSAASDPLPPLKGVRIGTWRHDTLLTSLERELGAHLGGWLEPERRIRMRLKLSEIAAVHLPDAIVHKPDGALVAVELELSAKSPSRLRKIIDGYATSTEFTRVVYIADNPKLAAYIKRFTGDLDFISVKLYRAPIERPASTSTRNASAVDRQQ